MRFIPKRPFRCLHCYHRFWLWESFFASTKRVITWIITLLLITLLLAFQMSWQSATADIGPLYEADSSDARPESNDDSSFRGASMDDSEAKGRQQQPINTPPINNLATNTLATAISEPAMSAQQLEQRLLQARAEAEQAKHLIEQKKALLEQSMLSERAELESLLKVDIGYYIEKWRKAWQAGNADRYLGFYSEHFAPPKPLSRESWAELRRQRVLPDKHINLKLSDFVVAFSDTHNQSTVTFTQAYEAGIYREVSRKQLVLLKEQQEWKIMSEFEIK